MNDKNNTIDILEKLNHVNRNFSKANTPDQLESQIGASIGLYLDTSFEVIYWEIAENDNVLAAELFFGLTDKEINNITNQEAPEFLYKTLAQHKNHYFDDCAAAASTILSNTIFEESGSMIAIPAFNGDKIVGIVTVSVKEPKYFNVEIQHVLTHISNLLAVTYQGLQTQKRHYNKLEDYISHEAFNKSVVEYGSDIIIILDPKGKILYHNPSSKETLGYDPGFLVGKTFFDFVHPKNLTEFKTEFDKSIHSQEVHKIEYQFLCANGKFKYLESNSINLMDKEGVEGLILDCRDITEKIQTNNELKKQQHFIQQVIDTDPNLIYVKNEEGKLDLINQAVADLHGSSKDNVIEMLNAKVTENPDELYKESKSDTESILRGEEIIVEESFTLPGGELKWFQTTKKALPADEGRIQMLSISVDITQRKKDAEELLSVQKAKEQFLANMSHEIRTPINGIAGLINLLAETNPNLEQKKYLSGIQSSAENLKVIINDILDISKIESGKLNFEKIGFIAENQISSVIETFKYRTDEKGLELSYHIEQEAKAVLLGDPVRLNQILMNLIGNAVKFTYAGYIKVAAFVESQKKDKIMMRFEVSDSGIGIPDDKIKSIFDSFRQADESVTRRFGGTGLGLAICKQLVELQGGQIGVKSVEREGTTFYFTIPYDKAKPKDIEKLNSNHESKMNIKDLGSFDSLSVLLVEDNDINQMYSSNILKKWNCQVDIAANGYIALEKLRKNHYDLILMDIQMPVMDGLETTRNIRNNFISPKADIPIIALTANAIKGDNVKCLEVGMNDYLPKPFVPEELFNKIIKLTKIQPRALSVENEDSQKQNEIYKKDKRSKTIVDLSYLKDISDNDEEFVKEMIQSFMENSPLMITQIKKAADNLDWEEVGKIAHKIKPSIVFMGINSIKDVVETIESNGLKNKNTDKIPSLIEKLEAACIQANEELKKEKVLV